MSSPTRKSALRCIYAVPLALIVVTLLLRYWHYDDDVWSHWKLLLPALQLVLAALTILRYRHARALYFHALIATGFIGMMAVAMFRGWFDFTVFLIADAVVHVGLPVCWLLAVAGIPAVPLLLKRRWFLPLKIWVLIAATLLAAEPAAWLLEPPRGFALDLPDDLQAAPRDEIHVAAIGGSSTLGHPYHPKFGFPQVVAWRLQQLYPDKKVVLHNLAKGGVNLRQAAHELHRLSVRPQLLLIYSGHNEFYHDMDEFCRTTSSPLNFADSWMRWSALFRWSDRWITRNRALREFRLGERLLVDKPIASPTLYRERLSRFQRQCEQLGVYCRRHGIAPIWFIPAASESGFEPNRSGRMIMSSRDRARLIETDRAARKADCQTAVELYRRALLRIPDFAEFHFRLAECLRKLGELEAARHHFAESLNLDGHPIRANRDYRDVIRRTARTSNAPLVETIAFLRPHADDRILGKTLFHDNVHMTLKGLHLTGLAGCKAIVQSGVLEKAFGRPGNGKPLTLKDAMEQAGLDRADLERAYRRTAFGFAEMEGWRFDWTSRHQQFLRFRELADALANRRIEPGQAGAESLNPD